MTIKQKTIFCTLFKNIPYTDEEWSHDTKWRMELAEKAPWYAKKNPDKTKPLKNRPNHGFRYGLCVYTESAARKICEDAIRQGAQEASFNCNFEVWKLVKNKEWKKIK